MRSTRILWGQLLLVSAVAFAAVWAATQWTAWRLGYQAGLGSPWFLLGEHPVYAPPVFFWWWYWYDAYAPHIFESGRADRRRRWVRGRGCRDRPLRAACP